MFIKRKLLAMQGYMDKEPGAGSAGGDDEAARLAAAEEAAKKTAEDEAAKKTAEEEAAKKKAEGGKPGPTDEEARLLKENMKKKEELKKTQDELAALRKQFEGIDPEAVRKLLADQKTAEEQALEKKGDYERLKTRMAEEHGKEVKTLKEQIEQLSGELNGYRSQINELTVGTQFSQSKFIAEELTLTPAKTRVIYGDHFEIEDGKVVAYDKPRGDKNRTPIVDQYGNTLAFDEALRKIIEGDPEKDHLLKSKVKPGAASDSKKPDGKPTKAQNTDAISKIGAGLKGLGQITNV